MKKFIISCDFYNNTFKYFKSIKKLYFFHVRDMIVYRRT